MPSRIDEAGHTKAFDYPVAEHWGESQRTKRSDATPLKEVRRPSLGGIASIGVH